MKLPHSHLQTVSHLSNATAIHRRRTSEFHPKMWLERTIITLMWMGGLLASSLAFDADKAAQLVVSTMTDGIVSIMKEKSVYGWLHYPAFEIREFGRNLTTKGGILTSLGNESFHVNATSWTDFENYRELNILVDPPKSLDVTYEFSCSNPGEDQVYNFTQTWTLSLPKINVSVHINLDNLFCRGSLQGVDLSRMRTESWGWTGWSQSGHECDPGHNADEKVNHDISKYDISVDVFTEFLSRAVDYALFFVNFCDFLKD